MCRADPHDQAESFQLLHASETGVVGHIWSACGVRTQIDDAVVERSPGGEAAVELRPPIGADLPLQSALHFEVGTRAEFHGHQSLSPGPHAFPDKIARDHQISTVVGPAADQDVHVRVLGVVVLHRDPIELGAEVLLAARHQVAREGGDVAHARHPPAPR